MGACEFPVSWRTCGLADVDSCLTLTAPHPTHLPHTRAPCRRRRRPRAQVGDVHGGWVGWVGWEWCGGAGLQEGRHPLPLPLPQRHQAPAPPAPSPGTPLTLLPNYPPTYAHHAGTCLARTQAALGEASARLAAAHAAAADHAAEVAAEEDALEGRRAALTRLRELAGWVRVLGMGWGAGDAGLGAMHDGRAHARRLRGLLRIVTCPVN